MRPSVATDSPPGIDALPSRVVIGLIVGLVGALAVAWLVPGLAVILVWPWLFVVPGLVIVRRVAPDLSLPGVVGVGIVTSVYLSAHVVDLVARIDAFGRVAVLLSTGGLVLGTVLVARVRHPWLAALDLPSRASVPSALVAALRRDLSAWLAGLATSLTVLLVLASDVWRQTADGFVSGGWNWSDFLVHVAIGNSIVHGNFPPQVPYVAGEPLTYHWFADFHGAISATAADISIIPVFIVSSALMAGALALVVWALGLTLMRDRRAATIATVLVIAGGGMGWLRLVADLLAGGTDVLSLVSTNPYDNSWADGWPFFRIASIFGTGLLPHRATTFGLPGLVSVVLLAVSSIGRRPAGVLLAGILAALLAPFHFYAFPATYVIVGLFVITSGAWRERTVVRDAVLFVAPAVLAMPYILPAILQQGDIGSFRFVLGWSEARIHDGPAAVAFFYLTNLGLPVVLAVIATLARGTPYRWFLASWLAVLFLVPNLVVVSAVEFDMNKYFQMMWIAAALLGAWLIHRWPRPNVVLVLAVCALSPALIAVWHVRSDALAMDPAHERAGRWIEANTPERSVFVTDDFINSPVDLAGRLRITTFGPYVANLGYDPAPRSADVHAVYCDGPDIALSRMARYGATYVLSSGGRLECADGSPTDFDGSRRFETVFEDGRVSIWRLADP